MEVESTKTRNLIQILLKDIPFFRNMKMTGLALIRPLCILSDCRATFTKLLELMALKALPQSLMFIKRNLINPTRQIILI